jgi:glycosyltransferase involved in cell wall biosynthesis
MMPSEEVTRSVPRVAHVTTVDLSLRYLLLNQLKTIERAGYEVSGISASGPDVSVVEAAGIRHFAVPLTRRFTPIADLVALWELYRVMRKESFDVVHTHTPKAGLLGQLAARLAGIPVVVNTLHGFYFHENMSPWPRRFYIAMEKIAALCADSILSQNREDIETAIAEGIANEDKLRWLGNGIDITRFAPGAVSDEEKAALRAELGIPEGVPVVGFVGRLVEEKGILDLLNAARQVAEAESDVRFLFVGPYDEEKPDALKPDVARIYGVAERCHFAGMRQDMPAMYALMDLLVLPSYREGFPRAPMEASAMGVAAIVSDVRGCREAVEHEVNGLRFPCGDVEALADAIITLLDDPKRRSAMGGAGRRLAEERFDERLVFARVLAEYERLLGERDLAQAKANLTEATP